ncbi:XrtA/PEP-CTERM system TPR-repeat protein PrsT [Roseomonas sp. BN140053]|uniref:XrtA/PEP-CTERM system TPR-repeat protein PrsT n=1 Tax=Roseomonas sp. BN140053 TaxID=3391898 RepID=UPI0039E7342C
MATRFRLPALTLAAALAAAPASASVERAQAAQARGDLRAAQIELRNAVRAKPDAGDIRAALAAASLDLGDGDTAEREARAAMERGYDRAAGTVLLLRAYLALGRFQDLLRDFPAEAGAPPKLAATVAAMRARAQLALDRRDEAGRSAEQALRLDPAGLEPNLAAAVVATATGNRGAAEAALARALTADADNAEALLRQGALLFEDGQFRPAAEAAGRVLSRAPGTLQARLQRGEALLRLGDAAGAQADLDAVLRAAPGNPPANILRAMIFGQAGDWRGADEALQRISQQIPNIPEALLLLATVKRAMNQPAQAEDAARRYFARRPEDGRGAKLLAAIEMEGNRPDAAAGTLSRYAARGPADAEALDLLGRAHMAAKRPREAAEAFGRAAAAAPDNAGILGRLAAARLATGDTAGMAAAAQEALRVAPDGATARPMLAVAALSRGDAAAAQAELDRMDAAARGTEAGQLLEGSVRLMRLDLPGARAAFDGALRANPESIPARLGLVRVAIVERRDEETERLLGEVLRRDPGNAEAGLRLAAAAQSGSAGARAALEAAQAAAPGELQLALITANTQLRAGDPARAAALLGSEPLQNRRGDAGLQLLLAEVRAAQGQWDEAEAASRAALAADPASAPARRQLAVLLARRDDARGAEAVLEEGLRAAPGDPVLQGGVVGLAQQVGGLDAALAAADRLAQRPGGLPAAAPLRGDLLLRAQRPEDAARAYAAAFQRAPSQVLALRLARAWQAANKPAEAAAALNAWLARTPDDPAALSALAQLDMLANRNAEAERRLTAAVERAPQDATALNNLAWLTQQRGGAEALGRARGLAERAYYIAPTPETADTLGWIRAQGGDAAAAVPLLRQAVAASAAGRPAPDPGMSYRLAYALRASGARDEAMRVLEPVLSASTAFPERAQAERLRAELRAGR